jgi:hypothetical protein
MKNYLSLLVFVLSIYFLEGCKIDSNVKAPVQERPGVQTRLSNIKESVTSTSTLQPKVSSTPVASSETMVAEITIPSTEVRLRYDCLQEFPNMPEELISRGLVILENRTKEDGRYLGETYLLDMASQQSHKLYPENIQGRDFSVSLDHSLMAYKKNSFTETGEVFLRELAVATADGSELLTIPWEEGWSGLAGWLDNQRLVINIAGMDSEESTAQKAASLLVLNLFTGERQVLRPDFPEMYDYEPIPNWDDWGITMYDPSLARVVYLRGEYLYALWGVDRQQLLATLNYFNEIPRWSPDGSRVVLEGWPDDRTYSYGPEEDETFLVSRDGQVEQLTNLTGPTDMYLDFYSWSPDGHSLAAWLRSPDLDKNREMELAIIDIETGEVTNTCLRIVTGGEGFGIGYDFPTIWSPDSTQLVVMEWYEADHRRVYLVDLDKGYAAPIAEDMEPAGWLMED